MQKEKEKEQKYNGAEEKLDKVSVISNINIYAIIFHGECLSV